MKTLMDKFLKKQEKNNVKDEQGTEIQPDTGFSHQMHNKFLNLNSKYRRMSFNVISILGLILLFAMTLFLHRQNSTVSDLSNTENKHTQIILNQLSDIHTTLQILASNSQDSARFKEALSSIDSDILAIKQSVLAEKDDIQKVSSQVISMRADVDTQMEELKRIIASNGNTKQYLDPKVLPFHVVSVDVIAQQPYVSIDYAHHMTPLAVSDALAGWQVIAADYDTAQVEFKNAKGQYVKVILQG